MANMGSFYVHSYKETSFNGYTLLLPSISVGNVPQLVIDLIVNTLKLSRVGWISDDSLLPVIGNDALDYTRPSGHLHTGAEVYSNPDLQLAILQLRSPVSKGCVNGFCKRLLSWCEIANFSEVITLSSSHSHERLDGQITGSQFRFLVNGAAKDMCDNLIANHNWKMMEFKNEDNDPLQINSRPVRPFLSGSGFAVQLHVQSFDFKFSFFLINMFCSQGDNIPDAVAMATHLNDWLKLVTKSKDNIEVWATPSSWDCVYGEPHPRTLY